MLCLREAVFAQLSWNLRPSGENLDSRRCIVRSADKPFPQAPEIKLVASSTSVERLVELLASRSELQSRRFLSQNLGRVICSHATIGISSAGISTNTLVCYHHSIAFVRWSLDSAVVD